jgi:hypothetical protein
MGQHLIQEIFEQLYSVVKIGAISVASSLSTLGLISSGPAALFGFKLRRSLAMPSQVMVRPTPLDPPLLPYFKVNICPLPLPHFASIFFSYL